MKILICDDDKTHLINEKNYVTENEKEFTVECFENGTEIMEYLSTDHKDVAAVLMDIELGKDNGIAVAENICTLYPQIKIIILTTFDDDEYVYNALKFGASGYLLKGVSMDELENAIKTVYSGKAMINPDIATKVLQLFSRMAQSDYTISVGTRGMEELTKTEWKIIAQVETGATNKEIAEALNLSDGTVRNYLSTILNKLDLRDRTQLAIWAVQTNAAKNIKEE